MKWTTANVKHPNYTEGHELFVGTHTGTFKGLRPWNDEKPFEQQNLQDLADLNKESKVTALAFGDKACTEILIGRECKSFDVHKLQQATAESIVKKYELQEGSTVGLARHDNTIIAGFANGKIQLLPIEETSSEMTAETQSQGRVFSAGDNMSRLRQCAVQANFVAVGGKERQNNLKIYDINGDMSKPIFASKNLPNDFLQLEVPVWDCDMSFIDSPSVLATCSRYGYVRVYDTRKQRRPVQCYASEEPTMSFTTLVARDNYIYTGTTMGSLKAFDIRRLKNFVHTYKGFTGAISDLALDASGKYLASACLDRYVRIHHTESTVMQYQCYVKSKATRILIKETGAGTLRTDSSGDNAEGAPKGKKNQKNQDAKAQNSDDEEYEQLFENMQTVCDDDEETAENATSSSKRQKKRKVDSNEPPKTNKKKK